MTPDLAGALRKAAQEAQRCYNRALRTADVQGSLMVKVQVEASGDICRVAIESSGPEVATMDSCVRALFEGRRFSPIAGGCLQVNIPVSFSIKD